MLKNMDYEYEFNGTKYIEDNEYDSEYEEEYSDPEYVEPTNEELDYMAENYEGKYVGEKRRSIPKCVKTADIQNLDDEHNEYVNVGKYIIEKKVYFLKKKPLHKLFSNKITINKIICVKNEVNKENEVNKVDKNEETNIVKHKNCWNKENKNDENKDDKHKNISLIEFPVIGTTNKDFKVLMNDLNDEKWIDIKEKTRKQKSSPTLSIKSNTSSKSDTVFTKLCSFIIKNEECPNKDNCTFAHKTDDLILKKCMFDENNSCRNVKYINGQYININKNMVCIYNHSRETRSNYLKRVYNIKPSLDVENKPVKKQIKIENSNENEEIAPLLTWCKKNEVSIPEAKINEKEDEWIKIEKEKNNRTKAFEILSDKEKIKTQLKFTKMCFSFINKTVCPHKENCRFAHDIKDLIIRDCLFQDKCFNVKKEIKDGQSNYINTSKTKICDCIHKDETNDNYYNRIGIKTKIDLVKQKSSPVQIIKKINIKTVENKNPWNVQKVPIIEINKEKSILKVQENAWNIEKVPIIEINKEKSILKVQENAWNKKPTIKEDIHIKVPKHMEEIVIKMALKNNKSVKVETY